MIMVSNFLNKVPLTCIALATCIGQVVPLHVETLLDFELFWEKIAFHGAYRNNQSYHDQALKQNITL